MPLPAPVTNATLSIIAFPTELACITELAPSSMADIEFNLSQHASRCKAWGIQRLPGGFPSEWPPVRNPIGALFSFAEPTWLRRRDAEAPCRPWLVVT
jgi:hypothetical protein